MQQENIKFEAKTKKRESQQTIGKAAINYRKCGN